MFLALQDPKPFIVVPIPAPAHEASFVDVIMSAMGLTGALIVASLVLGAVVGGVLVVWNRFRPRDWRPMPPVAPSLSTSRPDGPPSSQSR